MSAFKYFYFPSSTGKNMIYARVCLPGGEPRGIVQIAHGIGEHIRRYDGFMEFLADNGFIAVGNDHLGHGKSAGTPAEKGIFSEINGWDYAVRDMKRLRCIMVHRYPGLPYINFGHSMGSFLTRTYLVRYPDDPDMAIICGTGNQPFPSAAAGYLLAEGTVKMFGAHKSGELLSKIAFGSYNSTYDDVRTPYDWLSRDRDIPDRYMKDKYCFYTPSASLFRDMLGGILFITGKNNLKAMNKELPVFFIAGTADPVGEYGKGVKRAYDAFVEAGMSKVSMKLYTDARHELLNEINKGQVYADILEWIEKYL